MILPSAPREWSARFQAELQRAIAEADRYNLKQNQRIELVEGGTELVITSPDGTKWKLSVDNTGTISTNSVL
jgi:hypothetical protein